MPLLIGADEAGYGPNLGPLVVCCTAWDVADPQADLYGLLAGFISRSADPIRLVVCDSKSNPGGLGGLERAALSAIGSLQTSGDPPSYREQLAAIQAVIPDDLPGETALQGVLPWCDGDAPEAFALQTGSAPPWSGDCDSEPLPLSTDMPTLAALQDGWRSLPDLCSTSLIGICFAALWPDQFNRLLDRFGNKSRLLGAVTMHLVGRFLRLPEAATGATVICDRQGGRQRYLPLLQSCLHGHSWRCVHEAPHCSQYDAPVPGQTTGQAGQHSLRFETGGESHLPVALASMVAKYIRELSMRQWNGYWCGRINGLRPTAGYPVDAERFRRDLRRHVPAEELPDSLFWRAR